MPARQLFGIERAREHRGQLVEPRAHRPRPERGDDARESLRRQIPDRPRGELRRGSQPFIAGRRDGLDAGQRGQDGAQLLKNLVALGGGKRVVGDQDHFAIAGELPLELIEPAHARQFPREQR